MRGKRKKTYIKQMFVVEKNNDKEFTFDDRSVLLQKKQNPSSPRSRQHDSLIRVAYGSQDDRSVHCTTARGTKKASSREVPGRG